MEKEKDKGKKLQELCSALYTVKRECSEQEQSLKQLKKRKEDLVKDIIPIMKDLKIKQVSYDTAKFSYSSKEVIHFPSKDNLMARKACIGYLSKLLGPDGLISLVSINYSILGKIREENQEHLSEYWENEKKLNPELKDVDTSLLPGVKKPFVKEEIRVTKK